MGRKSRIAVTVSLGLALAGALSLAAPVWAQGTGGGLVISALPSDTVIGAVGSGAGAVVARPVVLAASPAPETAAELPDQRRRADMPRPSIIVGDLAILAAIGPRGPLGLPFPAREAIRQRDAALFERLLGRGVFDPDPERMAEAIQTELQRMDCYGGGIDGRWGSGSSGAAERWQKAAGLQVGTSADAPLFRAIAQRGDLRCPAVVQPKPAAVARTPDRQQPRRRDSNRADPPRVAQQPKPAAPQQPAKSSEPRISPALLGAGMYR